MKRIVIVGTSCTGKTTLSKTLERKLGIPAQDIDELHWLPDWKHVTTEELEVKVSDFIKADSWSLTGNYSSVRALIWERVDTVIWLNYPLPFVLLQALKRSLKRIFTIELVCNGNRETFIQTFFTRDSILWWIIKSHGRNLERYREAQKNSKYSKIKILEFYDRYELQNWLDSLSC